MGVGVDLALEQLLGTGHGEHGHLLAQVFLRAVGGGGDLGFGQRLLAVGFGDRVVLGLVDDLVRAGVGLLDDLVGLDARVLAVLR